MATNVNRRERSSGSARPVNWADKSGANSVWLTPPEVLAAIRDYFGAPIPLDPATRFFTKTDDGLARPWKAGVFVNPPYSKSDGEKIPPIRLWIAKIHAEAERGTEILALLPCGARFSTGYWQDHALVPELRAVCFVRGRVNFIDGRTGVQKKANTYDSMIYGFNADPERFAEAFRRLGACFDVRLLARQLDPWCALHRSAAAFVSAMVAR
jgi:phage N-6-adenine-methyltransferase